MIIFDKSEIRKAMSIEDTFELVQEWGGDPMYTDFGFISETICHNQPGVGSRKLYYYSNEESAAGGLFHCYTGGCEESSFDIYELVTKVFAIQKNRVIDLNDAVRYVAARLGIAGRFEDSSEIEKLVDWDILSNYDRIQNIEIDNNIPILKEYDANILNRLRYDIHIMPWLKEGISQEVLDFADIGYYLGGDQITIPHFDCRGRLVGLRGRTMCIEEAERFGKYRPIRINGTLYSHPLGLNLYGLSWAKENIQTIKKAIVFESEKATLQYMSWFGLDSSICVAACGSNLSITQVKLLLEAGAEEIIVAFDKQYPELNTPESKAWANKLTKFHNKYKNDCLISFIWDKNNLLDYKDSPTDKTKEIFLKLFKERIML